jgi:hypothetical protein
MAAGIIEVTRAGLAGGQAGRQTDFRLGLVCER